MILALMRNCLAQRSSFNAIRNRFAGVHNNANSSNSGSNVTLALFSFFIRHIETSSVGLLLSNRLGTYSHD